ILGCTGIVGQQFIRMLENHPYFEISLLTASKNSKGKAFKDIVNWYVKGKIPESVKNIIVMDTHLESIINKNIDIFFCALPSQIAKDIELSLANSGVFVFSNASSHRMNPEIPILIPEVNPEHINLIQYQLQKQKGFIMTNPNCSTAGLVMSLKPLLQFGIKSVTVTTYQAISGAGRLGIPSMDILNNVIPYIHGEEIKIEKETQKILGSVHNFSINKQDIDIFPSCCRVPVRDGHLESVSVELAKDVDEERIFDSFRSFKGTPQELKLPTAPETPLIVCSKSDRPQPIHDSYAGTPKRAEGMAVPIGRIKKKGKRISFFLLVHNTIRGAAGTSILNAEMAFIKNYLKKS
ncbi:MAG: aspartate-semialdehyde dehydrogenase, partial [Candidatus Aminicenantaceae bacterium]